MPFSTAILLLCFLKACFSDGLIKLSFWQELRIKLIARIKITPPFFVPYYL